MTKVTIQHPNPLRPVPVRGPGQRPSHVNVYVFYVTLSTMTRPAAPRRVHTVGLLALLSLLPLLNAVRGAVRYKNVTRGRTVAVYDDDALAVPSPSGETSLLGDLGWPVLVSARSPLAPLFGPSHRVVPPGQWPEDDLDDETQWEQQNSDDAEESGWVLINFFSRWSERLRRRRRRLIPDMKATRTIYGILVDLYIYLPEDENRDVYQECYKGMELRSCQHCSTTMRRKATGEFDCEFEESVLRQGDDPELIQKPFSDSVYDQGPVEARPEGEDIDYDRNQLPYCLHCCSMSNPEVRCVS